MADRRQKSTQQPPRRAGKVIPFPVPANLASAPEPAQGQESFDFLEAEEQESEDGDE